MFDLEKAISQWKKSLRKNPALEEGYIDELESHLRDVVDEHLELGISPEGSFNYAVEQLGDAYELGNQFYKTYTTKFSGSPSWQTPVWMPSLLWNYIKIALRNIKRHKSYSLINIFGFSVALIPAVLTFLYVAYEFSYDKHNENYDRIYRIISNGKYGTIMPVPLGPTLKADAPEIEETVRMRGGSEPIKYKDKEIDEKNVMWADPEILKVFSFEFVKGNPTKVFKNKYSIIISESAANRFFGNQNPIGKTLTLRNIYSLKITGIYKDLPQNSHFDADFIVPVTISYGSQIKQAGITMDDHSWGFSIFLTYVLLKQHADPAAFEKKINSIIEKYDGNFGYSDDKYSLQPLADIHLKSHLGVEHKPNADITQITIFFVMAFVILITAVINYVNLSTARATKRIKEIGVRKVIGASKTQLIRQLMLETIVITSSSFVITLLLVNLILPYFENFIGIQIQLNILTNLELLGGILFIILLVSIISGMYPAFVLSSMQPLSFFSGTFTSNRKPVFRSILVILQFVMTILLIIFAGVVNRQIEYIANKDLGYSTDNIIILGLHGKTSPSRNQVFRNELLKHPGITGVSFSSATPGDCSYYSNFIGEGMPKGHNMMVNYMAIDNEFMDLYNMKLIDGRAFSDNFKSEKNEGVIINETALKETGWKNPIGKIINHRTRNGDFDKRVIGVVKDFQSKSFHAAIPPFYLVVDSTMSNNIVSIKITEDNQVATLEFIKYKIEEVQPDYEFKYTFFSDLLKSLYKTEYKMQTVFTIFSVFTILISCLGLFGLVSFTTETRQKEIGIRKVLGASSYRIGVKILSEMMILIIIASILAAPLAYFGAEMWLEDFAYKTDIGISVFILSGLLVYALSIAAMILQVRKAAIRNPVDTLKYE
jgi:putative ABC transport system permease protein